MTNTPFESCRRPRLSLPALLVAALALAPIAMPAGAAPCAQAPTTDPTCLANEPLQSKVTAPPNVVLTIDDSSSMLSDFLPDFIIGNYCRNASGAMAAACGSIGGSKSPPYIYSTGSVPFPNYAPGNPPNAFAYTASSVPNNYQLWVAPVHNGDFNKTYYNPRYTYEPPIKGDAARTPYPNQDATVAVTNVWTQVLTDVWAPLAQQKKVNLTSNVSVPLFCNSDWPIDQTIGPAGAYAAGKGVDCRINGTRYDADATGRTNAPAVDADYQYPWGTAALKNSKYFYRNGGNKLVYCKANTAAEWPQTCSGGVPTGCTMGGTLITTPGTPQPQTCYFTSNKTGTCTNTYSPAGCNTNPAYDLGGCVGPECKVCTNLGCTPPITGKNGACHLTATGTGGSGAGCSCTPAGCNISAVPCADYTPPTTYSCTVGALTYPCTKVASPTCADKLWDPVAGAPSATTILADANGAGVLCRHNNQTYGGGPSAGPFNYPDTTYKYGVNGATVGPINNSNCGSVASTVSIPRHYWKTSVEWCTKAIATANDKWQGYGLSDGTCQPTHDATHIYPRFYEFGKTTADPEYADNYKYGAFERVDLNIANRAACNTTPCYTHTWTQKGKVKTVTRGFDAEMTNYANWFTYYRTRILATKTTTSLAYQSANLDDFRMGFETLSNNPTTSFVNLATFDPATQRGTWYNALFGINILMGVETPNLDAIVRVGDWFKTGASASLSGATDPLFDPKLTCQKNYHILFTDGITNQPALPTTTVGNVDNLVPALPQPLTVNPPIVAGSKWPDLYQEGATALANTAADYTTYYWVNDLRPAPAWKNNVPESTRDPAPWQHLNFAALSLGTEGTLAASQPTVVEGQLATGALKWPNPTPNQYKPNATGVDDLWHASVNGRGRFVNAQNAKQLRNGFEDILADIVNNQGARAGISVSNPNLKFGQDNFIYRVRFEPGWGGSIAKVKVDPSNAQPVASTVADPNPVWDAQFNLKTAMAQPGTPWYDLRKIVTMDDSRNKVPFLQGKISTAQFNTFGADDPTRLSVLEYLRGRRDNEGIDEDSFRIRVSPLGDIVNSQAAFVGPPTAPFQDGTDPGYAAFKAAYAARPSRVYVGANDGMVHAFDDATGDETWAYIPHDLYRGPIATDGLFGLTVQPLFDHHMLVDAPPRNSDVYYGGNWHSILVGGLGKGGKTYYAIDITDPASITKEQDAADKVLWEFRDGDSCDVGTCDLGYTSGKPLVAKLPKQAVADLGLSTPWVVLVAAGYNNSTGAGKIYILDPQGDNKGGVKVIKTLTNGSGSKGSPSGLAHFAGYTQDFRNQIIEQVYAGDLNGDVWRWDLTKPVADWNASGKGLVKFAHLADNGGKAQPVTTPPQIEVDVQNGVDRWVFIGTGRLLDNDDLKNTDTQSMYAFRDGTNLAPSATGVTLQRSDLDEVLATSTGGLAARPTNGWFQDLTDDTGSRIVVPPQAELGLVGYVATSPPTDQCSTSAPSRVFVREFARGNSRLQDASGGFIASLYVPEGGAGIDVVALDAGGGAGYATIPDIRMIITTANDATPIPLKVKLPDAIGQHRMTWRQLGE